jgi:hypothetical protein
MWRRSDADRARDVVLQIDNVAAEPPRVAGHRQVG